MTQIQHRNIPIVQNHTPYRWVVENATERLNLIPTSDDLYKRLFQKDDNSEWVLLTASPIQWEELGKELSASDVKTLYESNVDTNAFTNNDKVKVDSIEQGQFIGRQGNTGFVATNLPSVAFDNNTRTLTVSGPSEYWIQGTRYEIINPITFQIPDVEGIHYLYIKSDGTIGRDTNFSGAMLYDNAYVTAIYWDATNKVAIYRGDERHTTSWHRSVHLYQHATEGAAYASGFNLSGYTTEGDGSLNSHAKLTVEGGVFYDEDIRHALTSTNTFRVFYKLGANPVWRASPVREYPIMNGGTGRALYNTIVGGEWNTVEVSDGSYVLAHIIATNDLNGNIVALMGMDQYPTITSATKAAQSELALFQGLPFEEMVPVATLIYQSSNGYTNAVKSVIKPTDINTDYIDWRDNSDNILMGVSQQNNLINQLLGEQNKSIGLISQPVIEIDSVNHTLHVGSCNVFIARTDSYSIDSIGREYVVPAETFNTSTDQVTYFLKATRTRNTVVYTISTSDATVPQANQVDVARIIRTGPVYHIFRFNSLGLNLPNKLESILREEGFKVISGLGIAADSGLVLTVSSGTASLGASIKNLTQCISDVDNIRSYYWNGSQFVFQLRTTLNNTQYNGPTGLVTASNDNRFVRQSLWRGVEDQKHIYMVYHRKEFTSVQEAINDTVPPTPSIIDDHAVYIGGVIYQRNSTTPIYVAPVTAAGSSTTVPHNNLGGLQGGSAGNYYHLTEAQHTGLTTGANTTLHRHANATTEVDGYLSAADKIKIDGLNISNWDMAYGWGDHSQAGYALSVNLATVATTGSYNDLLDKPDLSVLEEVLVFPSLAQFPITGETQKVYIAEDTGYMYRWSGTEYVQLTDQTAIWGQISGTLSNQTDLQTALNGKQETLVSGLNIKTINNESLLGEGNIEISGQGGDPLVMNRYNFVGDGVTSTYTLGEIPISENHVFVYISGVYQNKGTSYTVTDNQITFSENISDGLSIEIMVVSGGNVIGGVDDAPLDGNPYVRKNGQWVLLNWALDGEA